MSQIKRLEDVKSEIAGLAHTAALSGDFKGFKDLKELLDGVNKGQPEAIDRAFGVYRALVAINVIK